MSINRRRVEQVQPTRAVKHTTRPLAHRDDLQGLLHTTHDSRRYVQHVAAATADDPEDGGERKVLFCISQYEHNQCEPVHEFSEYVSLSATVHDLGRLIQCQTGLFPHQQSLSESHTLCRRDGSPVSVNCNLNIDTYGNGEKCLSTFWDHKRTKPIQLVLTRARMQLFVKIGHKTHVIRVFHYSTVRETKVEISTIDGAPKVNDQRLVFGGRRLVDDETLDTYAIQEECTLYVYQ